MVLGIRRALGALGVAGALAAAAPAVAQQFSAQPDWARVLLAADMDPAASRADPVPSPSDGIAARLAIAPAEGGVARVIRFSQGPQAPARLQLLRFTGHPRVGWSQWGGDAAAAVKIDAASAARLAQNLQTALRAGALSGEARQATSQACTDGVFAYLEIAQGANRTTYERRCVREGAAAAAIAALSAAAGSETEEALAAAGVAELLAADRAFNDLAQAKGAPAAFVEYAHEDAMFFYPGREPYRGKDGVRERFARWPAGAKLVWSPQAAEVSARGDMGWTWGRGDFITADGKRTPSLYVSIWRRDFDGQWRYVVDIGVDGPPLAAPAPSVPPTPTPPAAPNPRGGDLRRGG